MQSRVSSPRACARCICAHSQTLIAAELVYPLVNLALRRVQPLDKVDPFGDLDTVDDLVKLLSVCGPVSAQDERSGRRDAPVKTLARRIWLETSLLSRFASCSVPQRLMLLSHASNWRVPVRTVTTSVRRLGGDEAVAESD